MNGPLRDIGPGDPVDPLATLLDRYAQTRLAPSEDQLNWMKMRLTDAYLAQAADRHPTSRTGFRPSRWSLAAAVGLMLIGGTSLVAAESGAGQPFYQLRLAIERLTLPSEGSARVRALLVQLDARLGDAKNGVGRGDPHAVADAIDAYSGELADLNASAASLDATNRQVLDELARHVAVLRGLLTTVPSQAHSGLQRAIDRAQQAQNAITQRPTPPADANPGTSRSHGAAPSAKP